MFWLIFALSTKSADFHMEGIGYVDPKENRDCSCSSYFPGGFYGYVESFFW